MEQFAQETSEIVCVTAFILVDDRSFRNSYPDPPTISILQTEVRNHQKAGVLVFLFAEPSKSSGKKGKRTKSKEIIARQKSQESKKARVWGSG